MLADEQAQCFEGYLAVHACLYQFCYLGQCGGGKCRVEVAWVAAVTDTAEFWRSGIGVDWFIGVACDDHVLIFLWALE